MGLEHLPVHLGQELVDARPVDEEREAVTARAVGQRRVLGEHVDHVHAEPVDAAVEPPAHHRVDGLAHLRVLPVEVGLLAREQVEVVLAGRGVELPHRAGEERAPVGRLRAGRSRGHAVAGRPPPVPVALGVLARRARGGEPGVLVGRVVDDQVQDQPHPALVDGGEQPVEVRERAERRVDVLVVGDVVAGVVLRRRVDRREPDDVDAQRRQVIEPRLDPAQVADPVAVGVGEAARVDLVDDGGLPPGHPRSIQAAGAKRASDPGDGRGHVHRIDVVGGVGLVVVDLEPGGLEQVAGAPREADLHHGVEAAVGDEGTQVRPAAGIRPPALDGGDEAREGEDPRRRRAPAVEPERVAHDRAHREPAEHGLRGRDAGALPQVVVERGERRVRGAEGVRVGVADARHDVPVAARPAGQRQRRARRGHVQPALGIEHVGQRQQVVLVGAAAVVEDEQAGGLPVRRPLAERQRAQAGSLARRGFSIGVSTRSSRSRRCACIAGTRSSSPRCSGASSTAKPGERVAISNRIPRGSRK